MFQTGLLLISFLGYFLLLYCIFHGEKTALYPAVLVSAIVVSGFVAGLLGCMAFVYSFVFVAGVLLTPVCGWYLVRRQKNGFQRSICAFWPLIVFGVGAIWLYAVLKDYFLYSYDDFTHWAKIIRVISSELRFPVEADQLSHASYPPGSALFVTYVSNVLGSADNVWLFSQGVMILSFWLPLLLAGKNLVVKLGLSLLIIPLISHNVPLRALHVDNLLAAAAFSGVMCCLETEKDSIVQLVMLSLVLCAVILIKSSGMFLALLICGYALYLFPKNNGKFSALLLLLAIPFVLMLAWNTYIDVHFTQTLKHQISIANYQEVLGGKSVDDIITTLKIILPIIAKPGRNHALMLIPVFLAVWLFAPKHGELRPKKRAVIFAAFVFVAYEIGMLLMYLFSMPMVEVIAQNGNDYDRYNGTITALLAALLLYLAASAIGMAGEKRRTGRALPACAAAAVGAFVCFVLSQQVSPLRSIEYQVQKYPTAYRFSLMQEEIASIPDEASHIVLFGAEEIWGGYDRFISQYYLRSDDIHRCYDEEAALKLRLEEPWSYYIDLAEGSIHLPTETVGVKLHTRTASDEWPNILDAAGYLENTRYSTTVSADIPADFWDTTGYIEVCAGDVIRLEKTEWYPTDQNEGRGGVCWFADGNVYQAGIKTKTAEDLKEWIPVLDADGNIIQITVPESLGTEKIWLRITCQNIDRSSIITVQRLNQ